MTGPACMKSQLSGRNHIRSIRYLLRPASARPNQIRKDVSYWRPDTRRGHCHKAKPVDVESECSAPHLRARLGPQAPFLNCSFPCLHVQQCPRFFVTLRCPSLASQAASLHGFCRFGLVHRMLQILEVHRQEGLEQAGSLDTVQRR
jgi:hypothetical protein